ncbi:MAG: hypothetical protein AAGA09_09665 [Pseudomonadota bacterium]
MTSASPSIEDLVRDPAWLPDRLDMTKGVIQFARLDRNALVREAFLDERKTASGMATAPIDAITPLLEKSGGGARPSPVFLFHSAFCCSTLMARALDTPATTLSLKEPQITMDLANTYRMAATPNDVARIDRVRDIVFALLARPHEATERVLIKPTNTANNLAPVVARSSARILFLYGDLEGFLISVLKKGEPCKAFVRKQYTIFVLDKEGVAAIPERQALALTDLQIAALVWRHQMELFARLLASAGDAAKSLDFRVLLDRPGEMLAAASKHLQLEHSEAQIAAAVAGPVFSTNAKFDDQSYDAGARARDEQDLIARHREELTMIGAWANSVQLSATPLSLPLANPLTH